MCNFGVLPTSGGLTVSKMLKFVPTLQAKDFLIFETNVFKLVIVRYITRMVFLKTHNQIIISRGEWSSKIDYTNTIKRIMRIMY